MELDDLSFGETGNMQRMMGSKSQRIQVTCSRGWLFRREVPEKFSRSLKPELAEEPLAESVSAAVPRIYSSGPVAFDIVFADHRHRSAQDFLRDAFCRSGGEACPIIRHGNAFVMPVSSRSLQK